MCAVKLIQLMVFRIFVVADNESDPKITNTPAGRNYGFVDVRRGDTRNYHSQLIL
jgi:hypothetical protein